jgi:hypothetical protein
MQAGTLKSTNGFYLAPAQPMVQNQRIVVKFSWEPLQGAKSYTITVSKDASYNNVITQKTGKDTLYILPGLESKTTYYWKVSAISSNGKTIPSLNDAQSFITPIVILPAKAEIPRGKAAIDGIISPGEWDKAAKLSLQYFGSGGVTGDYPNPEAQMMWDDTALYMLFKASTPTGNPPKMSVTDRDGAVYTDDAFEIFLSHPDSTVFYQFIFNWLGTQYDGRGPDAGFNPNWIVKTTVNGTSIIAEVAIPWDQIERAPKAGEAWKCNLAADFNRQTLVRSWSKYDFLLGETKTFGTIVLGN